MDEEQWLVGTDPTPMLEFLRDSGRGSDRKLRLFAVACCRMVRHLLLDDRLLLILDGLEREADGWASAEDHLLRADWEEEQQVLGDSWGVLEVNDDRRREILARPHRRQMLNLEALQALSWVSDWNSAVMLGERGPERVDALFAAQGAAHAAALAAGDPSSVKEVQADTLRDIFGYRPLPLDPSLLMWKGGTAAKFARAIYDDRLLPAGHLDTTRLAILGDMVEEAGCCDEQLLMHLRGPGPHVRGCFAVDLLLGKV